MSQFLDLLAPCIPQDHSRQVTSKAVAERILRDDGTVRTVLDLGCGLGEAQQFMRAAKRDVSWVGLDLATVPSIGASADLRGRYSVYDGTRVPFADGAFDLVYSNQVFEHVRFPATLLPEVNRVLRPNGYFVGSTSQLEPYHVSSVWNFTPYGFRLLIEEAGLRLTEIRPGIDGLTLIVRRALGEPRFFSRWWERESPLNRMIGLIGRATGKPTVWINGTKLVLCGQFCFVARKP